MNEQMKKFSYEQNRIIVAAIRRGVEKVKHHKNLTSRVEASIRAELEAAFWRPICFSMRMPGVLSGSLEVYGCGCDYNNRFYSFMDHAKEGVHWSDLLLNGLLREDMCDYQERERTEVQTCAAKFFVLDKEIFELEAKIAALRAEAASMIEALPVPTSAKLRTEKHFWTRPSKHSQTNYPHLFPK